MNIAHEEIGNIVWSMILLTGRHLCLEINFNQWTLKVLDASFFNDDDNYTYYNTKL